MKITRSLSQDVVEPLSQPAAAIDGHVAEWLYTVVFDGRELFGADADPTVTVTVDAFEPYLQATDTPLAETAETTETT